MQCHSFACYTRSKSQPASTMFLEDSLLHGIKSNTERANKIAVTKAGIPVFPPAEIPDALSAINHFIYVRSALLLKDRGLSKRRLYLCRSIASTSNHYCLCSKKGMLPSWGIMPLCKENRCCR